MHIRTALSSSLSKIKKIIITELQNLVSALIIPGAGKRITPLFSNRDSMKTLQLIVNEPKIKVG